MQILPGIPPGFMIVSWRILSKHDKCRCSFVLPPTPIPFWMALKTLLSRLNFQRARDACSCCHRFGAAKVSELPSPPFFPVPDNRSTTACRLRALSSHRCPTTAPPLAGASLPFEVVSSRSRWMTPQVFLGHSFLPGRPGRGPLRIPRTRLFSLARLPWLTRLGKKNERASVLAWITLRAGDLFLTL